MASSLVNLAPEIDATAENFKVENQEAGEDILDQATEIDAGASEVIKSLLKISLFTHFKGLWRSTN